MRDAPPAAPGVRADLKRELVILVGLVVLVDGVFIAIYYAAALGAASGDRKLAYTAVWVLATLVVVWRSLARIRAARVRQRRGA
ncbi:MAG: hypothetical protein H0T86_07905 [Gemmatimonadales bacterium]|nr:hypothetical protein [Gemmatimonadales bacterium]